MIKDKDDADDDEDDSDPPQLKTLHSALLY
jgi:hypothetical protein